LLIHERNRVDAACAGGLIGGGEFLANTHPPDTGIMPWCADEARKKGGGEPHFVPVRDIAEHTVKDTEGKRQKNRDKLTELVIIDGMLAKSF